MRTIDTVVFDLDDTLHDDSYAYITATRAVADALAAESGLDAARLVDSYVEESQAFWRELSADHLRALGSMRAAMWERALAAAGARDPALAARAAELYHEERKKHYKPFPGAVELLRDLRARGLGLGLITNGFSSTHREKLALLGLERAFDAVVIADECGMVKPDPAIFRYACREAGSVPERAAMVGDRFARDIVGGRNAGMLTVYIDMHAEPIPPGERPDVTVATIAEVGPALERMAHLGRRAS